MSRTRRRNYLGKPARDGQWCRKCPEQNCEQCGQGKAKLPLRRRQRHTKRLHVSERVEQPWLVELEQDPTRIERLFEQYGVPIPPHRPGEWVGINLETRQPVVLTSLDAYEQLTHSPTPYEGSKEPQ